MSHFRINRRRAGMAIVMVMMVVALVAVMGYAMLENNMTKAHMSSFAVKALNADALAESGVNLAAFYLQNPSLSPTAATSSYWAGQSDVSFGSAVPGTCSVAVASLPSNVFRIVSVGKVANADTSSFVTRTAVANVQINYDYTPAEAAVFNGNVTIPSGTRFSGNIRSANRVTLQTGSQVTGTVFSRQITNAALAGSYVQTSSFEAAPAPTTVHSYTTYQWTDGNTYAATPIVLTSLTNVTLGPTLLNPGGVYYTTGNLKLLNNVIVNGTLQVGQDLEIAGTGNTFNAPTKMPAVVVKRDLLVTGTSRSATVNGLIYITRNVRKSGLSNAGSTITVNGSLVSAAAAITWDYNGAFNINYDHTKAQAGNLSDSSKPSSISFLSWRDGVN